MKKIILLSLSLMAGLILLNSVKAATDESRVKLEILTGTSACTTVDDIDLGANVFSYNAVTFSGNLQTNGASVLTVANTANARGCIDQEGLANWTVTVQSTDVINMTSPSLNATWTIGAEDVTITSAQADMDAGSCTVGTYTNSNASLDSAKTVLGKSGAQYEVCELAVDGPVNLKVTTAPSQPIGVYSGTLTITSPF